MPIYTDRSQHRANQGDIFENVPFAVPRTDRQPSLGMVISHDCECDKYLDPKTQLTDEQRARWVVTAAHVHPLAELSGSWRKLVQQDRMPRFLLLPAEGELPDLVVDFWTEQPV